LVEKLKHVFQINEPNKVLFKNFTSLSLLQISNYIFPLITLPYLVRVLGPEKYGLINFAAAFTGYFTILTDYGFNLSATQGVSVNRNSKKIISEIFSSVLTIKFLLFFLSALIFLVVILLFPLFHSHIDLFTVTFIGVLGTVLFPLWLYQGIEQMKYILIINVLIRSITVIMIFVIVKKENDFFVLAVLYTITQLVIGIIGLFFAVRKFDLNFILPSRLQLLKHLKNGWNLFLSTIWINLYTTSNVFILGLFASNNVVGYYAAADKIRIAFQGVLSSMSQSVFPYVSKMLGESYERFISFNKKLLRIAFSVGLVISITLFLFAEPIVRIVLGKDYAQSITVLRIIAWLPLIIFLSNVSGIQTMLPLNKHKSFSAILFFAAIINLTLAVILVSNYFEIGTAISVLATEIFVTLAFFVFIKKNKILII